MNESDLAKIETTLGVSLPQAYRDLMLERAEELQEVGEAHASFAETFFGDADQLIRSNQSEREAEMGTADAFPKWWKKFVLVGTNGGGDYFCLRLQGDPHVWMIGSDCGSKPKKKFESFSEYVDSTIHSYVNPEPEPSSFDASCPLLNRFQVVLWSDQCKIRPLEGDRPLSAEKLQTHGIAPAEIEGCVQSLVSSLAKCTSEAVRISDQPPPPDNGALMIGFAAPAYSDTRLAHAQVEIVRGYITVEFRLTQERAEKTPDLNKIQVDWPAFQQAVVRLLEVLHPAGTRVTITRPQPDRGGIGPRYEWTYTLNYTLKP